jgi:NADPH-dependent glutamate synthase beta subunit-like oxidoreductase/Pyruvate/2-oxoacid:ferredoxin oxidoreductase delta subunit
VSKRPELMRRDFESESSQITPVYKPKQVNKSAPCQTGCANCGDIRGWIGTVAQRAKTGLSREQSFNRAWRIIADVNPFPSSLGRICPHPCEKHCNRSELDEPLAVNAMERFLGDWAIRTALTLPRLNEEKRQQNVGVIGAGPSGLSFAYQMARRGYAVTVYEGRELAGGMLRYGVPDYRLPGGILQAEIDRILDLGVELQLDTRIGRDVTLDELRIRHSFLYLGIGAQKGRHLHIPGEEGPSVWTGAEYLEQVNCGRNVDVGGKVIVIGGGNSAIDAARCARRQGAEVNILYRRTVKEMPAFEHEIESAVEEGIKLHLLTAPLRILRHTDERISTVVFQRMRLGEADESGRRRPLPIAGSEFSLHADTVISAVSQAPSLEGLKGLDHQGNWLVADEAGNLEEDIVAGGDALGLGIAGNAIMQGRQAAEKLHERFNAHKDNSESAQQIAGRDRFDKAIETPCVKPEQVKIAYQQESPAVVKTSLPADQRIAMGMAEVTKTITEGQFLKEVERCLSCGSCFGCEQCFMYCTAGCFTEVEEAGPGMYFTLSLDQCKNCGKCVEVCPCGFLEVSA